MVLKKLEIVDYRIFKGEQIIRFPEKNIPVVFVGVNGAGKTTVLEAIIGSLWLFYHSISGKTGIDLSRYDRSNVNISADEFSKVILEWEGKGGAELSTGFGIRKTIDPSYEFINNIGINKIGINDIAINDYVQTLKGDVAFYKNESSIPIMVYYPAERTVLNPSFKTKDVWQSNPFEAFDNAFDSALNFDTFFEWFRMTEDTENEVRLNKDNTYSDKGLDAVRKAIMAFLEKITKLRVKRTNHATLILEKSGEEYEVNQLSHGEKTVIAMVGDLARRLVLANPGNKNPLNGTGVVMIDEIDLHLHPNWQKTILKKLRTTFPNIQFICTTHSSLVLNHLDKKSIFLLEEGIITSLSEKFDGFNSYGADIEDILKIVQGVENTIPKEIKIEIDKIYEKIENGEIDVAQEIISKLKLLTDPDQPEIKKAETQIKYKKLMGK